MDTRCPGKANAPARLPALCLFLSAVHLSGPILQPAAANALFLPLNNRLSSLLASAAPVDVQYKEIEV